MADNKRLTAETFFAEWFNKRYGEVKQIGYGDCLDLMQGFADQQTAELKEWKRQQMVVWGPVLDYMQDANDVPIGSSISKEVLTRLKQYYKLKAAADKLAEIIND